MRIGIPRETKPLEGRVALLPHACRLLVDAGHEVLLERDAGALSGYADAEYAAAGARIVDDHAKVFAGSELIVKVKEPQADELPLLTADHCLFSFLHLAAAPELSRALLSIGLTAVGFETVEEDGGELPILAPMSHIAGRITVQVTTTLLHSPQGGKGLLLGGIPAAERGRVVVIGAGNAGSHAVAMAAAIGAEVHVFERKRKRQEAMRALGNNVTALYPYPGALADAVAAADIVIGAVLIPGHQAPHLVSRDTVRRMAPGSVIADISVDQGGCIETTRPLTWDDPVYTEEGVLHFAVTNMPGAVPRTASQALSAALIPYVLAIAQPDWKSVPALSRGINVEAGEFRYPGLEELFA